MAASSKGQALVISYMSKGAGSAAGRFWRLMPLRAQALCLWDQEPGKRRQSLEDAASQALLTGFAWLDDRPLAMCLLMDTGPGPAHCGTGLLHLLTARTDALPELVRAGANFIERAHAICPSLLALIPCKWFGALGLARALGFTELTRLRHACWLARHKRWQDGILLSRHKETT